MQCAPQGAGAGEEQQLGGEDQAEKERDVAVAGAAHLEVEDRVVGFAGGLIFRQNHADVAAGRFEPMAQRDPAGGFRRQDAAEDGLRLRLLYGLHILPIGEDAEALIVAQDAELDGHLLHGLVQIFDDEQGISGLRQIFAELLRTARFRQVQREMRLQKAHLQKAEVFLGHHPAMPPCCLAPSQGQDQDQGSQGCAPPALRTGADAAAWPDAG